MHAAAAGLFARKVWGERLQLTAAVTTSPVLAIPEDVPSAGDSILAYCRQHVKKWSGVSRKKWPEKSVCKLTCADLTVAVRSSLDDADSGCKGMPDRGAFVIFSAIWSGPPVGSESLQRRRALLKARRSSASVDGRSHLSLSFLISWMFLKTVACVACLQQAR